MGDPGDPPACSCCPCQWVLFHGHLSDERGCCETETFWETGTLLGSSGAGYKACLLALRWSETGALTWGSFPGALCGADCVLEAAVA